MVITRYGRGGPVPSRYLGLAGTHIAAAERHEGNARRHMRAGDLDYAAGSLRKAARFRERARQVEATFGRLLTP